MVAVNRKASQIATVITDLADDDFWLGVTAGLEDAVLHAATIERYIRNKFLADPIEGVLTVPPNYLEGDNASALLNATALAARALRRPWQLRGGVIYTALDKVTTWTSLNFNEAQILTVNAGQADPVIEIAARTEDVEVVPLETANAWTLIKGSAFIPELVGQRGWTYTIDGSDTDIQRAGGGRIRQGQSFTVVTDDGQISTALRVAFTQPFAAGTVITRQRVRKPLIVSGLNIRVAEAAETAGRDMLVAVRRSNSVIRDAVLFNEMPLEIRQGFLHENCEGIVYDNSLVDGLHINATNYGWNGNIASGVTFRDCRASGSRRDIEGHKCVDYRVVGGNFPDGLGGHWLHGLYLSAMPTIGASNPNNPYCIQMAGSDLIGAAHFQLDNGSIQAVKIRGDIFELGGVVDLRGSVFRLDNSANQLGEASPDIYLVRLGGQNPGYDTGRAVSMPAAIDMTDVTVELVGDCNFSVRALALTTSANAASFPQPIQMSGRAEIDLSLVNFPDAIAAGCSEPTYVGLPPVRIDYLRPQTSVGTGYEMSIRGIPDLRLYADAGVCDDLAAARAAIRIEGLRRSRLTARYGGARALHLTNCARPEDVEVADGTNTALGDEEYSFNAFARPTATNLAAGRYFHGHGLGPNTASVAVEANKPYLFAFERTVDIDALAIEITGAGAGGCYAGIYAADAEGNPWLLMATAAELDTNSTGIKPLLISARRLWGKCFLAMAFSGTPTLRASTLSATQLHDAYGRGGFNTTTADAYLTFTDPWTYGPLPVLCPAVKAEAATSGVPAIAVRTA
ncbi:hypothetical protein [Sphingobium ummariense]|uniref:Uncharacterized protein n=1 Tax=Sphingobium ummariense RL-3 TaxID=1346791 RepID=T0J1V4_9SPHN|nr:hypothetical protein [Sphingobium ummariense]EQB31951.1 hypothetical protein M529_12005 [Sphingobium ummariense RL-3]